LGLLFGLGIEVGQTWFPGRIPSLLDAVCDGLGAGIGGSFGYFLFRALRGSFGAILTIIIRQRPSLIVLAVFILVLLADAYYPFEVTIDISTVWNSFKHIHWLPFVDGSHRFRIELLVEKGFLLAAVGYLVTINLRPDGVPEARALAWCLCTALAAIVEGGKLFFAGRVPNGENVILCAGGALFGTFVIVPLSERELVRTHSRAILIVLLLGLEVYSELLPFDWVSSIDELWSRVSTIEWLPFAAYYGAAPQSALFDLGKKLIIVGPLGFVVASRKPGRSLAALFGLISGAMLEASQVALRSRTASITDVLIFGIAAWSGAVAFEHFARIRSSERPGKFNEIPGKVWLPITGEENRTDKLSPARRRQD
jgi:VanZ family protein